MDISAHLGCQFPSVSPTVQMSYMCNNVIYLHCDVFHEVRLNKHAQGQHPSYLKTLHFS